MEQTLLDRTMPYSIEAEKSVLGALLLDPVTIATIQDILQEEDFYKNSHQQIYRSMLKVFDSSGIVDLVTLMNQLDSYDQLENIGGRDYLIELSSYTPTSANVEHYAKIVKDKAILRQLINITQIISQEAYSESDEVANIVERSEKLILSLGDVGQQNAIQKMRELVNDAYEKLIYLSNNKGNVTGLATGYNALDKMTTGFHPDQLIILAARPAVGKTAFALNIAQNVAVESKLPVAIFSLEMGALDLVFRMICAEGNIDATNMRTGQLTEEEWKSFTVATDTLKDTRIFIDDSAGIKISEIRSKCRRLKQEHPDLALVVIDYLQLIESSGRENRQQEVSEISRQLKKLAKELSIPVIALSQLSRSVENRHDKRPMLSDIRESGSIEQDADIVAFLYRDDYYDQKEEKSDSDNKFQKKESTPSREPMPENTVDVILAKNRSGERGTARLYFRKEYNKFSDLSYMPEPVE